MYVVSTCVGVVVSHPFISYSWCNLALEVSTCVCVVVSHPFRSYFWCKLALRVYHLLDVELEPGSSSHLLFLFLSTVQEKTQTMIAISSPNLHHTAHY